MHIVQGRAGKVKLIGHSMGGLVVAAAIGHGLARGNTRDLETFKLISGIAFVATPLGGAHLAKVTGRLTRLIGENIHISDLRKDSASRKAIVTRFINHALEKENPISLTIFRASADSVVNQSELVEPLGTLRFDTDVLNGEHSDCIQNLETTVLNSPKALNLLKFVSWIKSTPANTDTHRIEQGVLTPEGLKFALESVSETDGLLLDCIRDLGAGSRLRDDLPTVYHYLQTGALSGHPLQAIDFISSTHGTNSKEISDNARALKPDLIVECGLVKEDRISRLRFRTEHEILLEVPNSPLLWPCSCELSDFECTAADRRLSREDCDIHKSLKGEQIHRLFSDALVEIQYDGQSFLWKRSRYLWPPSIDALNFIEDLREEGVTSLDGRSVLDVGCGCGILGIWFSHMNRGIRQAHFSDWLISPLIFTAINSARQTGCQDVERFFWFGLDTSWRQPDAEKARCDILLCNPPYLPFLEGHEDVLSDSTVAGTELLEHVIRQASWKMKRTYVSFSDLALPEAKLAAKDAGVTLVDVGNGGGHIVPFRVVHSFAYPNYLSRLIDVRGLEIRKSERFPLWHRVKTYRVMHSGKH
jgi:hypothetical protein